MTQQRLFPAPPRPALLSLEQRQRNAEAARRIVEILEAQERRKETVK